MMTSHATETEEFIDLRSYWLLLQRRWLPSVGAASFVLGVVVVATILQRPSYEAKGTLLLSKKDRVSSLIDLTDQNREISGLTQSTNPLDTESEIIRSVPLIQKTITTLNLRDHKNRPLGIDQLSIDYFSKRLKAKGIRGTDVLEVSYRGVNPQETAAVVNTLMRIYLDTNIQVDRAEARAAQKFINNQLPLVEARVVEVETLLKQFKQTNNVVNLEEESKVAVDALSKLSAQATQTRAELADVTSRVQSLQVQMELTSSQAIALTTLSQSTAVQEVLKALNEVQDKLALQRTRYRNDHPEIVNLLRKEAALSQQLQMRVSQALGIVTPISNQNLQLSILKQKLAEDLVKADAERFGLASRLSILNKAITNSQSRMSLLPKLEQRQQELERRLQVARITYEQLLKRLQEVEVAENQNVGNARIVSVALVPSKPISPRLALNLALGVFAGLLTGLFTAFVLDAMDHSVKTADEAEKLTEYPLLGVIPFVGNSHNGSNQTGEVLPVQNSPYSAISTNFEMLQTTLRFTVSDFPLKVILVTSAVSGEGKSFVAANLAAATARMGRRVLLIDADMRQPNQHTIWQQINIKGLSDILVEQATLSEIVYEVQPNLGLVTSGTMPPNPVALLDSQRFASLIESIRQDYDFVILDTPALNLVPDGLTIGKFMDGVLFIVRPQVANSADVIQAKTLLAQTSHRVLGMVVNGCLIEKGPGSPYYASQTSTSTHQDSTQPATALKQTATKVVSLTSLLCTLISCCAFKQH